MKNILTILKKYPDYTAIAHAPGLCCPECDMDFMRDKPDLVVWCETNIGHMMVMECPKCFTKFRYHATGHWDDTLDEFRESVEDKLYHDSLLQVHFANAAELLELVIK